MYNGEWRLLFALGLVRKSRARLEKAEWKEQRETHRPPGAKASGK